jgi:two-component system NtrC family sensor kinase
MAALSLHTNQTPVNRMPARFTMPAPPLRTRRPGVPNLEARAGSATELADLRRFAALGRLSAEIAHEINNPLNAILLTAEAALLFPDRDDAVRAFELIRDEVTRAGRITKSVLGFARGSTVKTPANLNEVVKSAVELACRYIHSHRLTCTMELAADLPPVAMNITGIEQVVVNLMKNAAEAGGGPVHVVVQTANSVDGVLVTIADDGPGIRPDRMHDLFLPLVSTKRDSGGTGLGLSISRRIIADHGGQLTVTSTFGLGSTFTIRLPADKTSLALTIA